MSRPPLLYQGGDFALRTDGPITWLESMNIKTGRIIAGVIAYICLAATTFAQAPQPNDYSDPKSWLCRPGRHDACDVDLTTTIVAADGKLGRETWKADTNASIDCFYVYPTVS